MSQNLRAIKKLALYPLPVAMKALVFGPDGRLYGSGSCCLNSIEILGCQKSKGNEKVSSISTPSGYQGLAFGPDGRLYGGAVGTRKQY